MAGEKGVKELLENEGTALVLSDSTRREDDVTAASAVLLLVLLIPAHKNLAHQTHGFRTCLAPSINPPLGLHLAPIPSSFAREMICF